MNEQIKEFIDKQQFRGWMAPAGEPERIPVILFDKESLARFVEKVVKECADFLTDDLDYPDAALKLKEHFGVEE